jgi:hypothetical protein
MARFFLVLVLSLIGLSAETRGSQSPTRSVEWVLRSDESPKITLALNPAFTFLGVIRGSAMGGQAEFEQYLFTEIRDGRMARTFIAHFEHVIPGRDFAFNYPRHQMVNLGGHEYLHQSWPTENWDLFESADVRKLLAAHSLEVPKRWLVDRFVRVVDEQKKSELILFYLEPAGALPASIPDLQLGGNRLDLWHPIALELTERAKAVFSVRD